MGAANRPPVGGPGGSGLGLIQLFGPIASELLNGTYDIVSWDPRGVGNYTLYVFFGLTCAYV